MHLGLGPSGVAAETGGCMGLCNGVDTVWVREDACCKQTVTTVGKLLCKTFLRPFPVLKYAAIQSTV